MITSTANQQVKNLVQLKKKARSRKEQQLFIVEGIRMFREAPAEWMHGIYASESFVAEHADVLKGKNYELLSDKVFAYVSDTKTPQGILCLLHMPGYRMQDLLSGNRDGGFADHIQKKAGGGANAANGKAPLILILENIQDPGNLGTMFRSGEGAGVTGILMDASTADIFNPKTIRSTMGSIYRVPFVIAEDLSGGIRQLQDNGVTVYAAHLKGTDCYDEPDYKKASAFLIGNEGNGLTDETAALADRYIRIPMEGKLESLNAAVAASLLMYETNRQRRK